MGPLNTLFGFDYQSRVLELAKTLLDHNSAEEARVQLERARDLFPASVAVRSLLAESYKRLGRLEDARASWGAALGFDRTQDELLYKLASSYSESALPHRALESIERYRPALSARGDLAALQVELLFSFGRTEVGVNLLQTAASDNHTSVKLYLLAADFLYRQGEHQRALDLLTAARGGIIGDADATVAFSKWYASHNRFQEAFDVARSYVAAGGSHLEGPMLQLAEVAAATSNLDAAVSVLEGELARSNSPAARRKLSVLIGSKRPGTKDSRLIVFIDDNPRARNAKISNALRARGWRTALLYKTSPNFDVRDYFDEAQVYNCMQKAILLAEQYNPCAYHVCAWLGDDTSVAFVDEKPGSVVFEMYDVGEGMMSGPSYVDGIQKQRYCIERADGVVCRDARSRYLFSVLGYHRPETIVRFADYCAELRPLKRPGLAPQDPIRLVSWGYIGTGKDIDGSWEIEPLVKRLEGTSVELHMYPHPVQVAQPGHLDIFRKFASQCSPFHFHEPIRPEEMYDTLAQYDLGLAFMPAHVLGRTLPAYSAAHFNLATSGRVADFLEVGLPVVVNRELRSIYHQLDQFGLAADAATVFSAEGTALLRGMLSDGSLPARMEAARAKYSLSHHIGRLERFYERIAAKAATAGK